MQIITDSLLNDFKTKTILISPFDLLKSKDEIELPVDYFEFYKSTSSVYSSKIEGENIDFDSYFKHKFLKVKFKSDYTQKIDDLFLAYEFASKNKLTFKNVKKAHSLLSRHLLPKSQQGVIRNNPMFVLNNEEKIEYAAAPPAIIKSELQKLFDDIELLLNTALDVYEVFYFASLIHLIFVKIHPFQDGNGRSARLIEKWYFLEKFGEKANSIQLEKNCYHNLINYYKNIRKLGLEYEALDYNKALEFLLMTISGL
jgi:Fic family protein